jgi:hypothetical protein
MSCATVSFPDTSIGKLVRNRFRLSDSWPLKIGPIGCPETSVRDYKYSLRNNPKERSLRFRLLFLKKGMNFRMRILVTVGSIWNASWIELALAVDVEFSWSFAVHAACSGMHSATIVKCRLPPPGIWPQVLRNLWTILKNVKVKVTL